MTGVGTEPRTATITNDTTPLAANYAGTCGGPSREAVYAVTSDIDGTLTVKLFPEPGLTPVLYGRTECLNTGTQFGCDDLASTYTLSTAVSANQPVYIFVDGYNGEFGISTLDLTVTP